MLFDQLKRREFITLLSSAAAWPLAARAQERTPVLGILLLSDAAVPSDLGVVRELAKLGYVKGRNITYAVRGANGEIAKLPQLARELLAAKATVLAGLGSPVASALGEATHDIPIVMMIMGDPIALGLSDSMSRPSRNVTGFTNSNLSLAAKRLELLRELVPAARKIGYLWAPESPIMTARTEQARMAAKHLGIDLVSLPLASGADVPDIFARVEKEQLTAILVESDALITRFSATIVDECLVRDLPAMHAWPFEVRAGALMAYGPALTENNQGAAHYIDLILKGAKVSDLPIQEPTQIKLAVNLRTARSIGLTIPAMLLARADEVIE
jgi:putative tryptophan/tyrosine transport system substrate-binding protein